MHSYGFSLVYVISCDFSEQLYNQKPYRTMFTWKVSLLCVHSNAVLDQLQNGRLCFLTYNAHVRFFTSMHSIVTFQTALRYKSFAANTAFVCFTVTPWRLRCAFKRLWDAKDFMHWGHTTGFLQNALPYGVSDGLCKQMISHMCCIRMVDFVVLRDFSELS